MSTESPSTVEISKMRAIFKKRSNGRLPGLKRFHDSCRRGLAFSPGKAPRHVGRIGHRNREHALISNLSLVRIVHVEQGGLAKKRYRVVAVKVTIRGAWLPWLSVKVL